ncbi:MAG TPA: hypothetical protein VMD59_21615, partial [Acidimicrobiales bacterium]|nr:hypothetical protein [Acidimicrobiales bacterium]
LTVSRATVLRPSDFGPAGVTVTWERLLPMSFHDVCVERGAQLPPCLPFGSLLASGAVLEQLDEDSGAELLSWFEEYLDHGGYPLAVAAALGKADSQAAGLAVGPLADHKQLFLVR